MSVYCKHNKGFRWIQSGDTFVKGYLFDENNDLYTNEKLILYFQDAETVDTFREKLRLANGFFAVIKKHPTGWLAGVDRMRSWPLFFAQKKDEILLSDDAFHLKEQLGVIQMDPFQKAAYLRAGHTLGNTTLFPEIQQLEAGQYLIVDQNGCSIQTYFQHLRGYYFNKKEKEQFEDLHQISNRIFKRLIQKANGRQLVVPLSGGYDSRYILAMLKKLDYPNLVTYTYGMPFSYEVKMARRVVEKLKVPWYFIEYPKDWTVYYTCEDYQEFASQLSSLPHEQDFLAIRELKTQKKIARDAIIVPGYCGDLLGGSVVPDFYSPKSQSRFPDLAQFIFDYEFNYENQIGSQKKESILKQINEQFKPYFPVQNIDDFINLNEWFFTTNFVSKYIVNSLRVYEYFGYEWSMPLWDNELMDWWYRVPNEERVGEDRLYHLFLLKQVFSEQDIDFVKQKKRVPKTWVKKLLGEKIMTLGRLAFLNSPFYKDINGTLPLLKMFQKDLKRAGKGNLITTKPNKIMAAWTLLFLENRRKKEL